MKIPQLPEFQIRLKVKTKSSELITIHNSEDIVDVCRRCFNADIIDWVESFIVIGLSKANKVLGFYKVSQGGVTGTVADPKVIMQFALLANATGLIVAHNHPSGNLQPSSADQQLTQKIKTATSYMDIKLLDHLIITSEGYYSFADNGLL